MIVYRAFSQLRMFSWLLVELFMDKKIVRKAIYLQVIVRILHRFTV